MANLETLAAELITEHSKLETLKRKVETLKGQYLEILQSENVGAVKVKEGTVTVCTRTAKDFGQTVKNLEANLKAEKARLEHLGEFTITNVTHYLRVS
jgi:hypothetical protein